MRTFHDHSYADGTKGGRIQAPSLLYTVLVLLYASHLILTKVLWELHFTIVKNRTLSS